MILILACKWHSPTERHYVLGPDGAMQALNVTLKIKCTICLGFVAICFPEKNIYVVSTNVLQVLSCQITPASETPKLLFLSL